MKPILSMIAVVSLAFSSRALPMAQTSATIAGIVLDNDTNQPLAGVQINLLPPESDPLRPPPIITDAHGRFALETKRTGRVRVVPAKNGFISYLGPNRAPGLPGVWIQLSADTRISGLELRMGRPGVISGRAGGRRPGTLFPELLRYTYGTDGKYALRVFVGGGQGGRPNDLGEFRFYDLPPGEYYIGIVDLNPATVGHGLRHYYPGLDTDQTKAAPIRVTAGEEVRLSSLQLPPLEKDVELKVRVTAPVEKLDAIVDIGNTGRGVQSATDSGEIVLRILPGHYDLKVTHPIVSVLSPSHYAVLPLDVGNSDIVRDVELKPTALVTGRILLENAAGERVVAPASIRCTMDGISGQRSGPQPRTCPNIGLLPKVYEFGIEGLPSDAYVLSVKSGARDILAEGINVTGDMDLEIVLGQPGAVIAGTVRTSGSEVLPHSTVALVPDAPYRTTGLRFRSVITDPSGKFEIHGIAPGSYKLFAWPELEGAAYRNAEFMKEFEDRGRPIKVDRGSREMVDFAAFDRQ